jgi:hypothetical protein
LDKLQPSESGAVKLKNRPRELALSVVNKMVFEVRPGNKKEF